MEGLAAAKVPSFSTEAIRSALTGLSSVMRPASVVSGGFGLAEGTDPCKGSNDTQVDNIYACQQYRTRYYYQEVDRFVKKASENIADITKAMALILGDSNTPTECGTRTEGLQPSAKFQAMLPKKWKGSTIDYILPATKTNGVCTETVGSVTYRGFEVLIKRPDADGNLGPVAHLKVQQALDTTAGAKYNTYVVLNASAKEIEVPNAGTDTYARLSIKLKDEKNFHVELLVDGSACRADYVSIPNEISVGIEVVDGAWAGYQVLGTPRFGQANCEAATNAVRWLHYSVADATHFRVYTRSVHHFSSSIFGATETRTYFCGAFPALCQDGKFSPGLTETVAELNNTACFSTDAAEPTFGFTSDYNSQVACGALPTVGREYMDQFMKALAGSRPLVADKLAADWATLVEE